MIHINLSCQARKHILKSKEKSKEYYDRNVKYIKFSKGDLVLVINEKKTHKYAHTYAGPFEIKEILGEETSLIQMGRKLRRVHNNKLKLVEHANLTLD